MEWEAVNGVLGPEAMVLNGESSPDWRVHQSFERTLQPIHSGWAGFQHEGSAVSSQRCWRTQ